VKQRVPSRVPTAPAAQRTWDHAPASDLHAARAVGPVSHSPLMLNVMVPSRRDRFLQDPPGPLVPPATFFPRVPSRVSVQSPRSKVQSFREAGPPVPDPWTLDFGPWTHRKVSGPDFDRPKSAHRRCRGSFSPLCENGSPPPPGILFCPGGDPFTSGRDSADRRRRATAPREADRNPRAGDRSRAKAAHSIEPQKPDSTKISFAKFGLSRPREFGRWSRTGRRPWLRRRSS
jgi:hypothetical protein